MSSDLIAVQVEQTDVRLGRQIVHDPESRNYQFARAFGPLEFPKSFRHLYYNPLPNPTQTIGNCTGCDAAVKANTRGNRIRNVRLGMEDATRIYSRATQIDPWQGSYPPEDTGSSGLAACKASREQGIIDRYEWIMTGARGVLAALEERPVGVGTYWDRNMFEYDPETLILKEGGGVAGGHQYTVVGWSKRFHAFDILCWWGPWGRRGLARIGYKHLDELLLNRNGDAHVTYRRGANA